MVYNHVPLPLGYTPMLAAGAGIEPAASSSSNSRSTGELHRPCFLFSYMVGPTGVEPAGGISRALLRRLRLPVPPRAIGWCRREESNLHLPKETSFSSWRVYRFTTATPKFVCPGKGGGSRTHSLRFWKPGQPHGLTPVDPPARFERATWWAETTCSKSVELRRVVGSVGRSRSTCSLLSRD